jgi:hypothetical protein
VQDGAVRAVVVHDEHAQVGHAAHALAARLGALGLPRQAQREGEDAAAAVLAGHLHVSAHELHELARDGEPEARAAVFARGGAVRLGEGLEKALELLGLQADARVLHLHEQHDGGVVLRVRGGLGAAHAHDDLARLGEFDRVADEVGEHLAEARGIAAQHERHVHVDLAGELQALLLRGVREQLHDLLDRRAQVEVQLLQLHLAGLDLGEVEDVVDDREQGLAAAPHRIGVLALLARERGVEEQARHPDDAVHRRADLVAHRGEELRLRLRGRLRREQRLLQHVARVAELAVAALRVLERLVARRLDDEHEEQHEQRDAEQRGELDEPVLLRADLAGHGEAEALPHAEHRDLDDDHQGPEERGAAPHDAHGQQRHRDEEGHAGRIEAAAVHGEEGEHGEEQARGQVAGAPDLLAAPQVRGDLRAQQRRDQDREGRRRIAEGDVDGREERREGRGEQAGGEAQPRAAPLVPVGQLGQQAVEFGNQAARRGTHGGAVSGADGGARAASEPGRPADRRARLPDLRSLSAVPGRSAGAQPPRPPRSRPCSPRCSR